jgi:hypothetical protein
MSHISGNLTWNEEVLISHIELGSTLVITLADGTERKMNYKNWQQSYLITLDKLQNIKSGSKVKIATWEAYNPEIWFCDIDVLS